MKRFLTLLALSLLACCCNKPDNSKDEPKEAEVVLSTNSFIFPSSGGSAELAIKSNVDIKVQSDADWCSVDQQASTSTTVRKYKVTAAANSLPDPRSASIKVEAASWKGAITVDQEAADGLKVSASIPDIFPADGGDFSVDVAANGEYSITSSCDWIAQETTRAMSSDRLTFHVYPNHSRDEREGTVTFTLNELEESVAVRQEGMELTSEMRSALEICSDMYVGWNLGNTLEATGGETSWGEPKTTREIIRWVKSFGYNAIRVPCAWDSHATDGVIDAAWMARVREVIDYIVDEGMYAILNCHWDGGWLENHIADGYSETINEKQKKYWTQIAETFREYPDLLLFAGCNEPNVTNGDAACMATLLKYEQTFVDAVRSTGGNNSERCLVIQGPNTDFDNTLSLMNELPTDTADGKLFVECHFYGPWNLCGMEKDESWGKVSWYWSSKYHVAGSDRNCTWGEEDYFTPLFAKMKAKFPDKGIPMILGEYGAILRDKSTPGIDFDRHESSLAYWNEFVNRTAKDSGMVPFYWDCGAGSGMNVLVRRSMTVRSQKILDGIMKGASEGKYPW